jgi:hypothetical protein
VAVSVQEIKEELRRLGPDELRRFAQWWEQYRESALPEPVEATVPESESEAVKEELLSIV